MQETLLNMRAATLRQRNISSDVKNGLDQLEESVDMIQSIKCFRRISAAVTKATQFPSPSMQQNQLSLNEQDTEKNKTEYPQPTNEKWQVVQKKKKGKNKNEEKKKEESRPQRKPKRQSAAVIIKPAEGKSYADILGQIRSNIKPSDIGAEIKTVRKTRTGDVLVELGSGTKSKADFGDALQTTLGTTATVRCLEFKSTIEIRDLDELTTEQEIITVLNTELKKSPDAKVFVTKANSWGQKMAIVTLPAPDAEKILKNGRIKIGWINCRVRAKAIVSKCFKCLGYGHIARMCTGPDRSQVCLRCGGEGHKASSCHATPSCVLCSSDGSASEDSNHVLGSSHCRAFREAFKQQNSRRK